MIVGGQAVNLWAAYFSAKLTYYGMVASKDLDALGNYSLAADCANAIPGAILREVSALRAVPMSAIVEVPIEGDRMLRIDFQRDSAPISGDEIERTAVEIPVGSGQKVRVMHPRHCLMSRTYNVVEIWVKDKKKYDNPIGLRQLQTAMAIFRLFMRELLANAADGPKQVQANYESLFQFLTKEHGKRLWETKKIDLFSCIEPLDGLHEKFLERRYPKMHDQLADRHPAPR